MTGKSKKSKKRGKKEKKTKGKGDAKNKLVEETETETIIEVEEIEKQALIEGDGGNGNGEEATRETETQTITKVKDVENQTLNEGDGGNGNGEDATTKAINGSESEEHEGDNKRKAKEGAKVGGEGDGGSEDDSRNKKRKLVLYCSKPNLKRGVLFEVLDAVEFPGFYRICDLETKEPIHSVTNCDAMQEKKVSLGLQKYDTTLKDWIEQHTLENGVVDSLCENYTAWGIKRPNEQARQIIRGILISVCDLRQKNAFHGALENLENYMIKFVPNYQGRMEQARADVTFRYKNMESVMRKTNIVEEGQQNDIVAVSKVIFGKILEGLYTEYPRDLQDLYEMLRDGNLSNENLIVIANHSSLWHWRERTQYYDRLCKAKKQCVADIEDSIKDVFKYICSTNPRWDWKLDVPSNTPLGKVLNARCYYSVVEDLVQFVRDVYEHILDVDKANNAKFIYVAGFKLDWRSMHFIESEVTSAFPMLLVEIYKGLSAKGIYV